MPENINTSSLSMSAAEDTPSVDNRPTMIKVDHVSMVFNMASEQLNSLKEYAIKIVRRELFFEGFTALDDIAFEVKKGDVFGIMGTNGSGKSTLLKIIAGVLEPTKGSCEIDGNIAPLIELGAGFDTELSARENIYLNGALLGYSKTFIDDHFDEIVEFAEIEKFLDMPLKNYSSGMVARIAFAIATVIIPDVLIVDEVLSVGDFMFQKKCEDRISELIDRHDVTVLIVSHSNAQIERLCNKAIWIEKGHTRLMGDASMVCRVYSGLGGRTGSAESELKVFEALRQLDDDAPHKGCTIIDGDSLYGTAVKAAVRGWQDEKIDLAVLTSDGTHVNTIVASGLAGAYGAPIIPVKSSYIPEIVEQYLYGTKPKTIVMIDKDRAAQNAIDQLKALPWNPEVITFPKTHGSLNLSCELYEHGVKEDLWGDTALIVDFADNAESFTATPLSYQNRFPVFVLTGEEKDDSKRLLEVLQYGGTKKVLAIGSIAKHPLRNVLSEQGIAVDELAANPQEDPILELTNTVVANNLKSDPTIPIEVCVSTQYIGQWPELLAIVGYAGKTKSTILLEDPTNLDNIASRMNFIEDHRSTIGSLTFFGGESVLNTTDQTLLYRSWKSHH